MAQRSGLRRRTASLALVASLAIVAAACSNAASPSGPGSTPGIAASPEPASSVHSPALPSFSPTVPPVGTPGPTPTQSPSPADSEAPTDAPPTPTPQHLPAAQGWTQPVLVPASATCDSPSAAGIDGAGRYHLASTCANGILYAVANPDGPWATTQFAPSPHNVDLDPQLAFEGGATYLAYDELGDGGCGSPGYAAVYYRLQPTPGGPWGAPIRIGQRGDGIEAFREASGTLYMVVLGSDGGTYFETVHGGTARRYPIDGPDAEGTVSMRLGTDGIARIAYWGFAGIRYGVFNGTGFTTETVAKGDGFEWQPSLVLDSVNNPHIIWTHSPAPGGCAGPDPSAKDGTYYATRSGGSWSSVRFTTDVGSSSFQIDPSTGVVDVVVDGDRGIDLFTRAASGTWAGTTLTTLGPGAPQIRLDPSSGRELVAFGVGLGEGASPGIYVMTRRG